MKIEVEAVPGRRPHVVLRVSDASLSSYEIVLSPTVAAQLSETISVVAKMLEIRGVHDV